MTRFRSERDFHRQDELFLIELGEDELLDILEASMRCHMPDLTAEILRILPAAHRAEERERQEAQERREEVTRRVARLFGYKGDE